MKNQTSCIDILYHQGGALAPHPRKTQTPMLGWVTSLFLTKLVDDLTRLCAWEVRGLVYMRDLSVPIYYMREHKLESTL